jgi:hypothetical protein
VLVYALLKVEVNVSAVRASFRDSYRFYLNYSPGALSKSNNKLTGVVWSEVRCFRLKFGLFLNLIYRVVFLSLRGGHSYEEWI